MNDIVVEDAIEIMQNAGVKPRPAQVELLKMLSGKQPRYVQAPTGVGKSFAVIAHAVATAMVTGDVSVIVAADNTLLDQYASKDLPRIAEHNDFEYMVVKGRSHYACASANNEDNPEYQAMLDKALSAPLRRGPELARPTEEINYCFGGGRCISCVGSDLCQREDCDHDGGICWAKRARFLSHEADVVLTNTSLWLINSSLYEETDGNVHLIPFGQSYVDEAQLLPATVRSALGWQLNKRSGNGLPKDLKEQLQEGLDALIAQYVREEQEAGRSEDAPSPMKKFQDRALRDDERQLMYHLFKALSEQMKDQQDDPSDYDDHETPIQFIARRMEAFSVAESEEHEKGYALTWIDKDGIHWDVVHAGPTIANTCRGWAPKMVSATVPGSLPRRTGFSGVTPSFIPQMFDWRNACKGYIFPSHYDPSDWQSKGWWQERWSDLEGLIKMCPGGTLILATSNADAERLGSLARRAFPLKTVLVQEPGNTAANPELIRRFKEDGHAILIGVESFWKGVDVQGPALSLVAIWKLPYEVPSLLHKAIGGKTKEQQIGYSMECMHTRLVQGIGRLLRTPEDEGVVVVCDGRFHKVIQRSLPQMSIHLKQTFTNR
ncbi:DNA helicase [Streptomyces phage Yara]|nr:DNA helicase [Streptomyces phage Yara]